MHIADITLFFAPHSGGVKRYLLAKHRYLSARSGARHSLLVPGARTIQAEPGIYSQCATRIPFAGGYRVPLRPWRWSRALIELAPDVIEVGDPYHLAWAALDAADRVGAAAVAFAHSDLPRMLACRFGRTVGRAADVYLRKLYTHFDLVQAPSQLIAQRLRDSGVRRVVVQSLGVDSDTFHPARRDPQLRAQLGLASDTRLLVFAGRMAREKQIPLLTAAFAALGARYHLLLIGAEEGQRLSPNVTLLPYEQDSVRLARLLASADALVHAGAHETFGMIVIEAMACGVPVIGMRAGGVAELIDDSIGALAEPEDPHSLRDTIEKVYERDLSVLGQRARARVERRYAWASTFALQLDRYARVARTRSDSHAPADTLHEPGDVADIAGLP